MDINYHYRSSVVWSATSPTFTEKSLHCAPPNSFNVHTIIHEAYKIVKRILSLAIFIGTFTSWSYAHTARWYTKKLLRYEIWLYSFEFPSKMMFTNLTNNYMPLITERRIYIREIYMNRLLTIYFICTYMYFEYVKISKFRV